MELVTAIKDPGHESELCKMIWIEKVCLGDVKHHVLVLLRVMFGMHGQFLRELVMFTVIVSTPSSGPSWRQGQKASMAARAPLARSQGSKQCPFGKPKRDLREVMATRRQQKSKP